MTTSVDLRAKRANIWEQAKALHEKVVAENRDFTAEEQTQWDRMDADMNSLKGQIDREERLAGTGAELERALPTAAAGKQTGEVKPDDYRNAFWAWARGGQESLDQEQRSLLRSGHVDIRAQGVAVPTAGGFAVADEDMRGIVDAMKFYGGMRQAGCTVLTTATGADLPIPTVDDTANMGEQLGENTQVNEQDITFGLTTLRAYVYSSKLVRVSYQLLQDAGFPLESWLQNKLGERLGRILNSKFTTGSGAETPQGVVTGATASGTTTASATAVTYAEMVDLELSVDATYRQRARWMFNDTTLKVLKKLVDGASRPLWLPGIAVREPDTLMSYPYTINSDMPNMAASQKAVLFGDFAAYYIRDVQGVTLVRLQERYADYLQVGFMAFSRHDGALIDAGQHPIKSLLQHA